MEGPLHVAVPAAHSDAAVGVDVADAGAAATRAVGAADTEESGALPSDDN